MLRLKELKIIESLEELKAIPQGKILINTINAHSYNTAQKDEQFAEALKNGDYLIPDGASIVMACRWLKAKSQPRERIAGWDLFMYEMKKTSEELRMKNEESDLNEERRVKNEESCGDEEAKSSAPKEDNRIYDNTSTRQNDSSLFPLRSSLKKRVMFLGSSEEVLAKIKQEASYIFHNIEVITFSPPYKQEFSEDDNRAMIKAINDANPDLLWIGMTAPKQEKWAYEHWDELDIHCHVGTVGAVFDFFAGTARRAPEWWQRHSLEWLYRLLLEPRRMWRRYLIGNALFVWNIIKEKAKS